jgi:hypothetical protein
MTSGDPEETRAYARLPGLDIAVLHRGARSGSREEVMIALRVAPSFPALVRPAWTVAEPLLLWARLGQALWTSWLDCLAAASAPPPWIARGE